MCSSVKFNSSNKAMNPRFSSMPICVNTRSSYFVTHMFIAKNPGYCGVRPPINLLVS